MEKSKQKKNKGFKIDRIQPADPNDLRSPTFNWNLPGKKFIVVFVRKKGSKFGGHFHKGEDPSKNPERLLVAMGRMKAIFVTPDGKKIGRTLYPGDAVTIYPYVEHFFEALDDVVFVDSRLGPFDKNHSDTYLCRNPENVI